ncbi:MAG: putative manganese transporter, partial [Clostridia bacterium]
MWDVLLDALLDSVKILPFLLVIYILIEFLETETASMVKARKLLCGKGAPIVGAGIGIVPQCGFSVVATNLYNKGYIALGTLFAVYISTSDEAIPIMLSQPDSFDKLWKLLLVKFIFAIIVGYVINLVTRNRRLN